MKIKVNGKEYETEMVGEVQRFKGNRIIQTLLTTSSLDMNKIAEFHQIGLFTDEEKRELYRLIGYSVCGYSEIFEDDKIENPMWDDTEKKDG